MIVQNINKRIGPINAHHVGVRKGEYFSGLRVKLNGTWIYFKSPFNVSISGQVIHVSQAGRQAALSARTLPYTFSELLSLVNGANGAGSSTATFEVAGPYIDDSTATDNGVAEGDAYELAAGNPYGETAGVIRINRGLE